MTAFQFSTTRNLLCEPGASQQLGDQARALESPAPFW